MFEVVGIASGKSVNSLWNREVAGPFATLAEAEAWISEHKLGLFFQVKEVEAK